jgi:excisionase family DNA binding protein
MAADTSEDSGPRTFLIDDAARLMGVSRRTVYYRIREGCLETIKTRCGSRRVVARSVDALRAQGRRKNATSRSVR